MTEATGTSNPFFYTTNIFNIADFSDLSKFTEKKDLVGAVDMDGTEYKIYPVTRTFLQVLYLSYKSQDATVQSEMDKFIKEKIKNDKVTEMWEEIKTENAQ